MRKSRFHVGNKAWILQVSPKKHRLFDPWWLRDEQMKLQIHFRLRAQHQMWVQSNETQTKLKLRQTKTMSGNPNSPFGPQLYTTNNKTSPCQQHTRCETKQNFKFRLQGNVKWKFVALIVNNENEARAEHLFPNVKHNQQLAQYCRF